MRGSFRERSPRSRGAHRNAIALLSHARTPAADAPSSRWLGAFSDRERVRTSGLWNNKHVEENYDASFLDAMRRLVALMASSRLQLVDDIPVADAQEMHNSPFIVRFVDKPEVAAPVPPHALQISRQRLDRIATGQCRVLPYFLHCSDHSIEQIDSLFHLPDEFRCSREAPFTLPASPPTASSRR